MSVEAINESILLTIKKMLGPGLDTAFDIDIIVSINSAIMILRQLGVGPQEGYSITSDTEKWSDYLGNYEPMLESVKQYIYFNVRLAFDPPSNSFLVQQMKEQMEELEWRLNVEVDPGEVRNVRIQ